MMINNSDTKQTQEIAHNTILKLQRTRRIKLIKDGELPEFDDGKEDPTKVEERLMTMREIVRIPRRKVFRTFERIFFGE